MIWSFPAKWNNKPCRKLCSNQFINNLGGLGWRSGENTRFPDSALYGRWVCCCVVLVPAPGDFLWVIYRSLVFLPPQKPTRLVPIWWQCRSRVKFIGGRGTAFRGVRWNAPGEIFKCWVSKIAFPAFREQSNWLKSLGNVTEIALGTQNKAT